MIESIDTSRRKPCDVTFFHIVWIFLIGSIVGLVLEVLVSYVLDGRWESRVGFVLGPFSPLYGLGAVLFTLALNPIRDRNLFAQFAVGACVGGLLEFLTGTLLEERYGIVAWSYIDQPLNFHGHTSIAVMALWGAASLVWILWCLPPVLRFIELMPEKLRIPLTTIAFTYIMVDSVLTVAALDSWFWRQAGYPVSNFIQRFCATFFDDAFMSSRFETMGMWTVLANR